VDVFVYIARHAENLHFPNEISSDPIGSSVVVISQVLHSTTDLYTTSLSIVLRVVVPAYQVILGFLLLAQIAPHVRP